MTLGRKGEVERLDKSQDQSKSEVGKDLYSLSRPVSCSQQSQPQLFAQDHVQRIHLQGQILHDLSGPDTRYPQKNLSLLPIIIDRPCFLQAEQVQLSQPILLCQRLQLNQLCDPSMDWLSNLSMSSLYVLLVYHDHSFVLHLVCKDFRTCKLVKRRLTKKKKNRKSSKLTV